MTSTIGTGPTDVFTPTLLFYRAGRCAHVVDPADAIVARFRRELQRITTAPDSPDRKKEEAAKLRRAAGLDLDYLEESRLADLIDSRDRAEALLDRPQRLRLPDGLSPDEARVQAAEIRSAALQRDPESRREMYLAACARDDVVAVRAFEDASEALDLLPDREETLAEGREIHGAAFAPEKYAELEEIRSVVESATDDLRRARDEVGVLTIELPTIA
jgi:hypothetical protein